MIDQAQPPGPPPDPDALRGAVVSTQQVTGGTELVIRLTNTADRALHYIADVRVLRYEPADDRVVVRLSDEGRILVPGIAGKLPQFRHVDPGAEAELALRLPPQIVKLARTGPPGKDVPLEKVRIADAAEVVVEIAWADVPFYHDPRQTEDRRLPAARWQQHVLTVTAKPAGPQPR